MSNEQGLPGITRRSSQQKRIGKKKEYFTVKPDLTVSLGHSTVIQAVDTHHQWCRQQLTIRRTSTLILFAIISFFTLYFIHCPLFIIQFVQQRQQYYHNNNENSNENSNENAVFSFITTLFALSNAFYPAVMVVMYAIQVLINFRFMRVSQNVFPYLIEYSYLIPLCSYPLLSTCISSMYLTWMQLDLDLETEMEMEMETEIMDVQQQQQLKHDGDGGGGSNTTINFNDNNALTYYVIILSLVFGFIPQYLKNGYVLIFPAFQCSRSEFLKKTIVRSLIANTLQSLTFCSMYVVFCKLSSYLLSLLLLSNIVDDVGDINNEISTRTTTIMDEKSFEDAFFWTLFVYFRITFVLNLLWMFGYLITNRMLTEKCDFDCHFNYTLIRSHKDLDYAIFSLLRIDAQHLLLNNKSQQQQTQQTQNTQPHSHSQQQNHANINANVNATLNAISVYKKLKLSKSTQHYFWYLSLLYLLNVSKYNHNDNDNDNNNNNGGGGGGFKHMSPNHKTRHFIYNESQYYFRLLMDIILSDFTTFITELYDHLISIQNKSVSFYQRLFYLRPLSQHIFQHAHALVYSAEILSFLAIHSVTEDQKGIVQINLEKILCVMLETLDILDFYLQSHAYMYAHNPPFSAFNRRYEMTPHISELYTAVEIAIMRIVKKFHRNLTTLELPQKNYQRLQCYINGI